MASSMRVVLDTLLSLPILSVCAIGRSQLQLLGAVCLLVAWKVREHEPLQAQRLVEYSDFLRDGHLNEHGSEIVGRELARLIEAR